MSVKWAGVRIHGHAKSVLDGTRRPVELTNNHILESAPIWLAVSAEGNMLISKPEDQGSILVAHNIDVM